MLNFGGQTKRRNINLGNKSKTSKRDVLVRAERDRTRRAEERRELDAAMSIQRYIRKHLFEQMFFSDENLNRFMLQNIDKEQKDVHLFPAFGLRLYKHLPGCLFKGLIIKYQYYLSIYPNGLINSHVTKILKIQTGSELLIDLLQAINLTYLDRVQFIDNGLVPFILKCKTINDSELQVLLTFLQSVASSNPNNQNDYKFLYPILSLNIAQYKTSPLLPLLLKGLGRCKLLNFNTSLDTSDVCTVFSNLCYIYDECDELYIQDHITKVLSYMSNVPKISFDESYFPYIIKLLRSSFSKRLANHALKDDLSINAVAVYLAISSMEQINEKYNILVVLLMNKDFSQMIFQHILTFSTIEEIQGDNTHFFEIGIELLNFFLTLATDVEIFSETSTITLPIIKGFSIMLKRFIFNELWNKPAAERSHLMTTAIDLITRIYTRDSRLHFCSTVDDEMFWVADDEKFTKCAIYKIIDEYDASYRNEYNATSPISVARNMVQKNLKTEILEQKRDAWSKSNGQNQIRKLEILMKVPFFIPFDQRVDIFYTLIALDKDRLGISNDSSRAALSMFMPMGSGVRSTTISREHILEDAMGAYNSIGENFKSKLSVNFVNEFGPEEGIDGGGVTKEFLTSVSDEGFKDTKYNLFAVNEQNELYPKPTNDKNALARLAFMGKVVGKCLYDHVLIDVALADFFLKKLLNFSHRFHSTFDDLNSMDSTLYANLNKLLSMTADEIVALDLTFEATDVLDSTKTIELITQGHNVQVTKHNMLQYVLKVAEYKLDRSLFEPVAYFHQGLSSIITPIWIEMFNSIEFEMLISGGTRDVDLNDLREHTEYGGYTPDDATVQYLWQILAEMTPDERCKFLKFVTSVPQAPLRGFASLDPHFGIRNAGDEDMTRLPTASTCVNLLKLPNYGNKELLREKLLYSINSGARFDLS